MSDTGSVPAIDGNKIASEVITQLTKDFFASVRDGASSFYRKNVGIRLERFEQYVQSTHRKCNAVRVILDKDRVYDLPSIYVQARYRCGDKVVDDQDVCQLVRDNARVVVQGFGGIGKTIFLKYLWLTIFDNPVGRIPVFIELKRLNDLSKLDLKTYLRLTISHGDPSFSEEEFDILCSSGRFVFLFDAFDEINDERRDEVERQILELANLYSHIGVIVSSRKDGRFHSWEQFVSYHALPFNREQVKKIITSVDFDREVRKKFLAEVIDKRDKFDQFSDFLSTPLLALMMLLMYRQFADVPERYIYSTDMRFRPYIPCTLAIRSHSRGKGRLN